jgi:hypothetical protein
MEEWRMLMVLDYSDGVSMQDFLDIGSRMSDRMKSHNETSMQSLQSVLLFRTDDSNDS